MKKEKIPYYLEPLSLQELLDYLRYVKKLSKADLELVKDTFNNKD